MTEFLRKFEPPPAGTGPPVLDAVHQGSLPPGGSSAGQATYRVIEEPARGPSDNRAEQRQRNRLRTGKIADQNGKFIVECLFHDRSPRGARVRLGREVPVPAALRLYDDERRTFMPARVIWCRKQDLGIVFVTNKPAAAAAATALGEQFYAVPE
jgi:hypothetical protein